MNKTLTLEQMKAAMKIPDILIGMFEGLSQRELVRSVYNEAINDAANFLKDTAPHNPQQSLTLVGAEKEVRKWLTIPAEQELILKGEHDDQGSNETSDQHHQERA